MSCFMCEDVIDELPAFRVMYPGKIFCKACYDLTKIALDKQDYIW